MLPDGPTGIDPIRFTGKNLIATIPTGGVIELATIMAKISITGTIMARAEAGIERGTTITDQPKGVRPESG